MVNFGVLWRCEYKEEVCPVCHSDVGCVRKTMQ